MKENEKTLPVEYYEEDNHIYGPHHFKTNGTITLDDYYLKIYPNGSVESFVTLTFHIGKPSNIKQRTVDIPLSALSSTKILRYIPSEFVMMASSKQKQDFLSNLINSYIIDMTSKELYVLDQGYNRLHDKVVYALGDIIINSDSPDFISHSPHKVKRHPKDKLYYKWLLTFSKLGDIFPALLIASLVPYIKPLLNESGIVLQRMFCRSLFHRKYIQQNQSHK